MKITAIGHASYLIETVAGTVLTDPVFFDPFEGGANRSYPDRVVNIQDLPKVNCVIISHRHFDHFDIQTLSALDRTVMVFYPDGETLIESALAELGFKRRRPLMPWAKARAGALEIIATPSLVSWPELGIVIRDGVSTLWSLIDTVIDREIIKTLREHIGDVDCLLAQYSPILQYELRDGLAGRHLDVGEYGWLFDIVRLTKPRVVVPSAGGLRYTQAEWQNNFGFPVTPIRFLADLTAAIPDVRGQLLEPGDILTRADGHWRRQPQAAGFVSTEPTFDRYRRWHHDPAVGTPAFADDNPFDSPPHEAYDVAKRYVTEELVDDLLHPANTDALKRWREWHVKWRLDLYPPRELDEPTKTISWQLDLADGQPLLAVAADAEVDMRTAVASTGIYDLLTGRCSPYTYLFTDRTRHTARVFDVTLDAVRVPDATLPEPLLVALTGPRDLDRAYVVAELQKWGTADQ